MQKDRRTLLWVLIPVTGLVSIVLVVATVFALRNLDFDVPEPDRPVSEQVPIYAVTPKELDTTLTTESDGRLSVVTRLIFEASGDTTTGMLVQGTRIGWESRERPWQYVVVPEVQDLTATELTDDGEQPVRLAVEPRSDPDPLDTGASIGVSKEGGWSAGRHVIELRYRLAGVHIDVRGTELIVFPLDLPGASSGGQGWFRIHTEADRLLCLHDNLTFEGGKACGDGGEYADALAAGGESMTAIAFTPPAEVTAAPIPAVRRY